jgi:hypothetical protein
VSRSSLARTQEFVASCGAVECGDQHVRPLGGCSRAVPSHDHQRRASSAKPSRLVDHVSARRRQRQLDSAAHQSTAAPAQLQVDVPSSDLNLL